MNKIPCVFRREFTKRGRPTIHPDVNPGCEWVLAGEGIATWKWDGTACMVQGGKLFKRYDAKGKGDWRPPGFIPCLGIEESNSKPGWIPVGDGPEDRWHREAFAAASILDGTYELVGPKIGGNPHGFTEHRFQRHRGQEVHGFPRTFEGMRAALESFAGEGVVFCHPDGRMAKIRRDDFGFAWPVVR